MKTKTISQQTLVDVPACRKLSIMANVRRYTTNEFGVVLDDAAVPVADRKPYPFHLFGEFDRAGGYAIADGITQRYNTILFSTFVVGNGMPLFFFNPVADINTKLSKGDIVFLYVNDLNAPTIFTFIVVHAQSGGFASLVNESNISQLSAHGWGVFKFDKIQYNWQNDAQLRQPLVLINTKFDGDFTFDFVNPLQYRNTEEKKPVRTIDIPLEMTVNQYNGISSFLDFANPDLQLLFELYI